MKWEGHEASRNVEDRRGQSYGRSSSGGFGGIPLPQGKMGLVVVAVVMLAGMYGIDLTPFLDMDGTQTQTQTYQQPTQQGSNKTTSADDKLFQFTKVSLKMMEDSWSDLFKKSGKTYQPATMVVYSGRTNTACGTGMSAMGPFYCPADQKVYLDLSFYKEMQQQYGGGGEFALGYVLAHEVGHHVQNLLGITDQVRNRQTNVSQKEANRWSVKTELQADCLAGVWGHSIQNKGYLENGDIEKALNTASAIGDDRLQRRSQGTVVPDSFTHGSSADRIKWFKIGYETGDVNKCNTFSAK